MGDRIQSWATLRPGGEYRVASDWRQLLTHDDVTHCGRLESLMADGLSVELQPDERLVLVERNTIVLDAMGDRNPSRTILGIQRERDGFGAYLYLLDGRRLVLTTNFAR